MRPSRERPSLPRRLFPRPLAHRWAGDFTGESGDSTGGNQEVTLNDSEGLPSYPEDLTGSL